MKSLPYLIATALFLTACGDRPPASMSDSSSALRDTLETIIAQRPEATVALAVRDPQTGIALSINGDRSFHAASTMKIPVMIEVYRQATLGRFSLDDSLLIKNEFLSIVDSTTYSIEDDSDDAIYTRMGEQMSIYDLVYQMITVSSNLATNLLIDAVATDSVQATSERLGTTTMRVLRGVEDIKAYRQGLNNTATADDLATLLVALQQGTAVSPTASEAMIGILLDQQFNEMIPTGLPETARAAHKTGWITEIHHDAAIVYPAEERSYILVILTEGIEQQENSAQLGAALTRAVHAALRPKG